MTSAANPIRSRIFRVLSLSALSVFVGMTSAPLSAQDYELIDDFQLTLAGARLGLSTVVRLDSAIADRGTTINFEDDLNMADSKTVAAFGFTSFFKDKHRIGVSVLDIDRDATEQVVTEIRFGDIVIPINTDVILAFELQQVLVDYTYYFKVRERYMLGVIGGFRWLDLTATLDAVETELAQEGTTAGPLPYLGLEYRYGMSPRSRFIGSFGVFSADVGGIEATQVLADLKFEFVPWTNVGLFFGGGFATIEIASGDEIRAFDADVDITSFSAGILFRF